MLDRDSAALSRSRAAAGMLRGGLDPDDVADAVRRTRARVVHAHNVNPSFGWRALAAARDAGARVVLHLHNYRLVCAVGTCFTRGADCTRCHGRNTLPGRAAGVPRRSRSRRRSTAPGWRRGSAGSPRRSIASSSPVRRRWSASDARRARRRARERGAAPGARSSTRTRARRAAGTPWWPPGWRPRRACTWPSTRRERRTAGSSSSATGPCGGRCASTRGGADVQFEGRRARAAPQPPRKAAVAIVPSRSAETFGLAAAYAMAAGSRWWPAAWARWSWCPTTPGRAGRRGRPWRS